MTLVWIIIGIVILIVLPLVFRRGSFSQEPAPDHITDEDILKIARQGQKIQAIKWYRVLHGVGLKEAKDAVDTMK